MCPRSIGERIFNYGYFPDQQSHALDTDVLERPVRMRALQGGESRWSVHITGLTSGVAEFTGRNAGRVTTPSWHAGGAAGSSSGTAATATIDDASSPASLRPSRRPSQFRVNFPPLDKPLPVDDAELWTMYQEMCSCRMPAQQLGPCVHATAVIVEASSKLRRSGVEVKWQLLDLFHPRVRPSGMCRMYRAMASAMGLSVDRKMLGYDSDAPSSIVQEPLWLYPDAAARAASAGSRIITVPRATTFTLSALPPSRRIGVRLVGGGQTASAPGDVLSAVLPLTAALCQDRDGSSAAAATPASTITVLLRGGGPGDGAAAATGTVLPNRAVVVPDTLPTSLHQPSPEPTAHRGRKLNFNDAPRRHLSRGELPLQHLRHADRVKTSASDGGVGSVSRLPVSPPGTVMACGGVDTVEWCWPPTDSASPAHCLAGDGSVGVDTFVFGSPTGGSWNGGPVLFGHGAGTGPGTGTPDSRLNLKAGHAIHYHVVRLGCHCFVSPW